MSDPEGPSAPTPAQGETATEIPLWVIGVAVALVLAMTVAFVLALTGSGAGIRVSKGPDGPPAPAQSGKGHHSVPAPAHWDHRILPLARIAEEQRGLNFRHPVGVRFLAPAAFEKSVISDSKLDRGDRREFEQSTGLLRALGLIGGGVDLYRAVTRFSGGDTLAYYSFKDKRVTIRGHALTPAVRSTLVHELTHALQDQHFHVGTRFKELQKQAKAGSSSTALSVLQGVVEGDAERVQTLYRASLSPHQQAALDASQKQERVQAKQRLHGVPGMVITMGTSPYKLGEALVQAVDTGGGNGAVDHLFQHPPARETALLDPLRYLVGGSKTTAVPVPALRSGEKEFDHGDFGVLTWYFMLGERLPLLDALSAADGWGGDAYVAYRSGGTSCARAAYVGRTSQDTTRMYDALRRWVSAVPGSSAHVGRAGGRVTFQSCDPGRDVQVGPDTSQKAMNLIATRTYLGIGIVRAGLDESVARCVAGRLVHIYPVSDLVDPSFGATDPSVQGRIQQIAALCSS